LIPRGCICSARQNQVDESVAGGLELDQLARARVRMDTGYASTCVRTAVQSLLNVAGASAFSGANDLH